MKLNFERLQVKVQYYLSLENVEDGRGPSLVRLPLHDVLVVTLVELLAVLVPGEGGRRLALHLDVPDGRAVGLYRLGAGVALVDARSHWERER